jgi:hypothetical protein
MPVSTSSSATQYVDAKDANGNVIDHPVLDPGDYHIKGTIDAHGAGTLVTPRAELLGQVVSLTPTEGGGIAYEFAIKVSYEKADAADAAAKAQAEADAKAAANKAEADAKSAADQAAQAAASQKQRDDEQLAATVAAAVAKAVAK